MLLVMFTGHYVYSPPIRLYWNIQTETENIFILQISGVKLFMWLFL